MPAFVVASMRKRGGRRVRKAELRRQAAEAEVKVYRTCKVCQQNTYYRKGVCLNRDCLLNRKRKRGGRRVKEAAARRLAWSEGRPINAKRRLCAVCDEHTYLGSGICVNTDCELNEPPAHMFLPTKAEPVLPPKQVAAPVPDAGECPDGTAPDGLNSWDLS